MTPTNSPLNYLDSTTPFYVSLVFAGDYLPIHYSIPPIHIGTLMRQDDRFFTPLAILRKNESTPKPTTNHNDDIFSTEHTRLLNTLRPSHSIHPLIHFYLSPTTATTPTKINGLYLTYLWVIYTFIRCSYSRRVQPRRSCS